MEDILIQIIREASPTKHVELRKACKDVAGVCVCVCVCVQSEYLNVDYFQ